MNNPAQVILISQTSLPYSKIGSWTTLYKNYLENNHKIDYIICPKPQKLFDGIQYHFAKLTFWHKLQRKFLKRKNLEYFVALDKIIDPKQKYIIQVVDNYGMVKSLRKHLVSKGIEKQCYIQFFYHGFSPYTKSGSGQDFYEIIDEMIVLTMDSYKAHQKNNIILPSHFSILNNGIDTKKFKKVPETEKIKLKEELGFGNKKTFVWCSQDRPKKGLELILEVWRKIYSVEKKIQLVVIGCDPRQKMEGVVFLGKIPNEELPKYYQASDCYLFPTLCQEGFGLSLIEALHCGNYCIASAFGGVPEVLHYGKLGKLIENPYFISEWETAINAFLEGNIELPEFSNELYAMENWNIKMNQIIDQAKCRLANSQIAL
ncbi:glycosyltransferase [Flavobacterium sp. Fl-318]|uniref:Glycosyltransferase n=1 Tax=Flavobacterium cupriresistens TaxID=2893885 RepID=A0ABU4RCU5_9FLAO|nr:MULTISPECIES: glycosyltransferase [unclassified Flavobacterium]MDX6190091.1 glycosyltransferase [Flavobacterium sp. Fl-318]UFH42913.1 glycosyltransferase family 4 protein [Flavobacterium sp. F-323]